MLEKLDVDLTTLELRCRFCEKPYDFEKERELRLSAKERINEIKILKEKKQKQVELKKKQYFNNKRLIVYVNHVFLGFSLCESRILWI